MENFSMGRALSRTFSLVRISLPVVGLLVLAQTLLSALGTFLFQNRLYLAVQANDGHAPMAIFGSPFYWGYLLAKLLLAALFMAAALFALVRFAEGQPVTLGESVSSGLRRFAPVFVVMILYWLSVIFGIVLLIIPGLILVAMWGLAIPVTACEDLRPLAGFGRSRALTRGCRLKILLLTGINLVAVYVLQLVLIRLLFNVGPAGLTFLSTHPAYYAFKVPFDCLLSYFSMALLASVYIEAVQVNEGGTARALGQVFQ